VRRWNKRAGCRGLLACGGHRISRDPHVAGEGVLGDGEGGSGPMRRFGAALGKATGSELCHGPGPAAPDAQGDGHSIDRTVNSYAVGDYAVWATRLNCLGLAQALSRLGTGPRSSLLRRHH
jgi:hypothetical protein